MNTCTVLTENLTYNYSPQHLIWARESFPRLPTDRQRSNCQNAWQPAETIPSAEWKFSSCIPFLCCLLIATSTRFTGRHSAAFLCCQYAWIRWKTKCGIVQHRQKKKMCVNQHLRNHSTIFPLTVTSLVEQTHVILTDLLKWKYLHSLNQHWL